METGSSSKTLTLISSDGEKFLIPESAALQSGTIKNMVEDGFDSSTAYNVNAKNLAKIAEYLKKREDAEDKKKFDGEFVSGHTFQVLLELVLAAHYLDIKELMEILCEKIAKKMKNRSAEWVRTEFGIENDLTEEEEQKIKNDYGWAFVDGIKKDNEEDDD